MLQLDLTILNETGMHARPAALFVKRASEFTSEIQIRNVSIYSDWVNAKSILGVLSLGIEKGHQIQLSLSGSDEGLAAESISHLITKELCTG